jgi:uncharacterized protein YbjT (DUF2867 family)
METGSKIAVAGATGRVGRHVVDLLEARGYDVAAMSRAHGVDVVTGEGVAEAIAGASCIIDAATGSSPDRAEATRFFTAASRNLQDAGVRAGVQRMVVVSIIGTDRFSDGYNAAKAEHERLALAGPIPVRILRAAQFHEFVAQLVDWGRQGDTSYVWRMRTQLVAARAVAEELVRLATDADTPATGSPILEVAGPREESLVEAAELLVTRRGDAVRIEGVSAPGVGHLYESDALLPGPGAVLAGPTFAEWLDSAVFVA